MKINIEWVFELKARLQEFIGNFFQKEEVPQLLLLFKNYMKGGDNSIISSYNNSQVRDNGAVQQLQRKIKEYERYLQEYDRKYKNLQEFTEQSREKVLDSQKKWGVLCKDLVGISKEVK